MLTIVLSLIFLSVFSFFLGFAPLDWSSRPKLQPFNDPFSKPQRKSTLFRNLAVFNKPFAVGALGERINKDLGMAQVNLTAEEFLLIKELIIVGLLLLTYPFITPDMMIFWLLMGFAVGYMLPEFWLKGKIKNVKSAIVRDLPDVVDLLALCVNAGLDFMLALKWVIEKSPPSILVNEMQTVLHEINMGKTRRDALRDLATKYELLDLSSLSRTLIQADKMGTSVAEALNILSEDMRMVRYRRGEQMALKAPLKLLVPLLFFIFPVVGVLVAGPIFLDFIQNNPMKKMGGSNQSSQQQTQVVQQ